MNKATRKTIIAGNWKMNMTPSAAEAAVKETAALVARTAVRPFSAFLLWTSTPLWLLPRVRM